ncbi:conjugal transfer protein TraF [Venatoribacter cucullus]|uniref:conjugal transfer protein TraF n=1 Tax=Venatoribacter cucullus TaxID=2661630 RepID=UPI00223ED8E9|nr:conjugal transfer protein TraF [Venatoribacter cucullus]UZK04320.1 hypothetical protein GAY96_10590 [Venatoribacter cucullus]
MMKRSLLAVAVTALTSQAVYAAPYMPMDARGLAMGNTGVASAKRAHAPAYNPSLLSQGSEKDDFALLFPQLGVQVADEKELADEAELISDEIFPQFEDVIGDEFSGLEFNIDQLNNSISSFNNLLTNFDASSDVNDIATANDDLKQKLAAVSDDLGALNTSTTDLTNSLRGISGSPLSAKLGIGGALAIPSKKFAAAISMQGSMNISARTQLTDSDLELLSAYVPAAQEYVTAAEELTGVVDTAITNSASNAADLVTQLDNLNVDNILGVANGFTSDTTIGGNPVISNGELSDDANDPDLSSTVQVVAVAIVDFGLSFSREFDIKGEKVAIGITPKLQKISTFHYADEIDGFDDVDEDTLKDTQQDYTRFNMDIGASYRFGGSGKWMVGVVGKNLLGGSFDYADVLVTPKDSDGNINGVPYMLEGGKVKLNPQFRAGVAYNGDWTSIALDVDLVENDPVAFENATQYASLGVELDVFSFLQLRAGYRTNMSASDANVASVGLGLSPFGVHLDIAAMANPSKPEKEAGVAMELGFYF